MSYMKQRLKGSASEPNPVCELPASTCFSGAISQYAAFSGVLWLRSCRYKQISEVIQDNFFLPENMFIPAIDSH